MRRSPRCLPLAVLVVLTVAGCGGGSVGPTTNPTASAPDATAPPADATQPGTGPVTTPTTTAPARTQTQTRTQIPAPSSAAGGSQSVRVPAAFVVVTGGRLTPPTITVPPFLAVEISLRSADGRAHTLVVQTPTPHTLQVAAGARAQVRIAGLRAGSYPVTLDGRRAGALAVGGDAGP